MAGKGKPCGASYISAAKACRINLPSEVGRALNAATGELGARTLWDAVRAHDGGRGKLAKFRKIRDEVRGEMGGNIVKGPKADELKKRLQAEGLLPSGKAKSIAPDEKPVAQWAPKQRDRSVPPELKKQLDALRNGGEDAGAIFAKNLTAKPENSLEKLNTDQLNNRREAARKLGKDDKVGRINEELMRRGKLLQPLGEPKSASGPKGMDKYDLKDMRQVDKDVEANTTSRIGRSDYDWKDSLSRDAKVLGSGAYGTAIRGGNGDVVKRGEIGKDESAIIDKVGKLGIGPKLISAELDGPGYNPNTSRGRLAMSEVPGKPVGYRKPDDEVNGVKVADAYWTARAQLHRAGIAHNDMHINNVLIDDKGRGRFVDMGMAQDNPKAAFAEAMGAFDPPRGGMVTRPMGVKGQGDWQVRQYEGTGGRLMAEAQRTGNYREIMQKAPVAARVLDNKNALQYQMQKDGFSKDDIATIMDHGLRNDLSTYSQGVWQRVSDEQAMNYINILYDGV